MSLSDQFMLSKGRDTWDGRFVLLKPFVDLPSPSTWDAYPASQPMFSLDSWTELAARIALNTLGATQACLALDITESKDFQHPF